MKPEPTLAQPPRSQIIATHPPQRLPGGEVLLRAHTHAGPFDFLFPVGLWTGNCCAPVVAAAPAAPAPGERKKLGRPPSRPPAGPEMQAALDYALSLPHGFGQGHDGRAAMVELCAQRKINFVEFHARYTIAKHKLLTARRLARLREAAR